MRWLIGVVLPLLVPVADVAAQQVSATVSSSVPSRGAILPAAQPEAFLQATRDEAVDAAGKGT